MTCLATRDSIISFIINNETHSIKYECLKFLFYFSASACSFRGLMAHCQMTIGGHNIDASARINKCHTPIDIYFLVTANNDRTPWNSFLSILGETSVRSAISLSLLVNYLNDQN